MAACKLRPNMASGIGRYFTRSEALTPSSFGRGRERLAGRTMALHRWVDETAHVRAQVGHAFSGAEPHGKTLAQFVALFQQESLATAWHKSEGLTLRFRERQGNQWLPSLYLASPTPLSSPRSFGCLPCVFRRLLWSIRRVSAQSSL